MTQDQYGQARGPGHVGRGDVVPDEETEGYPTESRPQAPRARPQAPRARR